MSFKQFLLEKVTLDMYWDMLNGMDWYYEYSDDHREYSKGRNKLQELKDLAKSSPEHEALYDQFRAHVFSGGEKPQRP